MLYLLEGFERGRWGGGGGGLREERFGHSATATLIRIL